MPHRFLDPVEPLAVQRAAAQDGLVHRQALVEVAHQRDALADACLHGADGREVLRGVVASEPELHRPEALRQQRLGLVRERVDGLEPQPRAVVGGDRLERAPEERHERHAVRLRQRVPRGHVDARQRQTHEPRGVEQREPRAQLGFDLERRQRVALDHLQHRLEAAHDGPERPRREREHVGVAGDAAVGLQIDQHEGGRRDPAARAHGRALERHEHRPRAEAPDPHGAVSLEASGT